MRRLLAGALLTGLAVLGAAGTATASDAPQPSTPDQIFAAMAGAVDGPQGPTKHGQVSVNEQHKYQKTQQHHVQSSTPHGQQRFQSSTQQAQTLQGGSSWKG